MRTFITLHYSPWSERARFALDHHRVDYRTVHHEPGIGEVAWRVRTGRFRSAATVPVLLDGETKLFDSLEIARYADRIGTGEPLFPPEHVAAIERWNAASERALRSGRKRSFERLLRDEAALADNLQAVAPAPVRRHLVPLASTAVKIMQLKYGVSSTGDDDIEVELDGLRAALAIGSGDYLLGRFTYADVTMASALHMVSPVGEPYIALPEHVRRTFEDPELRRRYADLVEWRDAVYRRHGPERRSGRGRPPM